MTERQRISSEVFQAGIISPERPGKIQKSGLETLHLSRQDVEMMLKKNGLALQNVFFAQMNGDGELHVQLDRRNGSRVYSFSNE